MNLFRPCALVGALSNLCLAAASVTSPLQTPDVRLSVVTRDDLNLPVAGTAVLIEPLGAAASVIVSGLDAATPPVSLASGATARITIAETPCARGISLGQVRTLQAPLVPAGRDFYVLDRTFHAPFALPVLVTPSSELIYPEPHHSRWSLSTVENADPVRFQCHVAMLLSSEEIASFAAYNGVQFGGPADDYRLGVVIRSAAVELGDHSLVLSVDCKGHGFIGMPIADAYSLPIGSGATQATWSSQVFDWVDQRAFMLLKRRLVRGDNVVLIKSGVGLQRATELLQPTPREIVPPPTTHALIGGDCIPSCPGVASGDCAPAAPTSDAGCYTSTALGSGCETSTRLLSYVCLPASGTARYSRGVVKGGSVTVKVKFKVGGVEQEVDVTGHYQASEELSVDVPIGAGSGCGQCVGECENVTACVSAFKVHRAKHRWVWQPENVNWPFPYRQTIPCGSASTESSSCQVSGTSFIPCPRVCQ